MNSKKCGTFFCTFFCIFLNVSSASSVTCNFSKTVSSSSQFSGCDHAIITTTGPGKITPLGGFGLYIGSNFADNYTIKTLEINTKGGFLATNNDGIRFQSSRNLNVDNLLINVKGMYANGINFEDTNDSHSKLVVNQDANISISGGFGGMGVRVDISQQANNSNIVYIGGNLAVSTAGRGENNLRGAGYGIYAGARNYFGEASRENNNIGDALLEVKGIATINTSGKEAHAVYANRGGVIHLHDVDILTKGDNADDIMVENLKGRGGKVSISGDHIKIISKKGNAINAKGIDSVVKSTGGIHYIEGDVVSSEGGVADLNMSNGSAWLGASKLDQNSTVNISLEGADSHWLMTDSSYVSNLTLTNNSNVKLYEKLGNQIATDQRTLNISNLSGNGIFYLRTDIEKMITDKIYINYGIGDHQVFIPNDGSQSTKGTEKIDVIDMLSGSASFKSPTKIELGAYLYDLKLNPDNPTEWILVASNDESNSGSNNNPNHKPNNKPNDKETHKTSTAKISMSIINNAYLLNLAEQHTLRQRLGDIHQNHHRDSVGDFWVKVSTGKLDVFKSYGLQPYDLDYNIYMMGADVRHDVADHGRLFLGGYLSYTYGKSNYHFSGSSVAKNYSLGLYATYLSNESLYIDGVLKISHINNSFSAVDTQGNTVRAKNNNRSYTASLEIGKKIKLGEHTQTSYFYLEPQAQITFSHQNGKSYKASNRLRIKTNSYDSTIVRSSIALGYRQEFNDQLLDIYISPGYSYEFSAKNIGIMFHESVEKVNMEGGARQVQVGANLNIKSGHNFYFEGSYAKHKKYKDKKVSLGYRYVF